MPKILIPTPLRQFADGQKEVEVDGATVGEALAALTARHAGLRQQVFNQEGQLRSFVNVYLNDDDVRYLNKDKTAVAPGDILTIVPSIAGGFQ